MNGGNPNCCRCYEVEWLDGIGGDRNKRMIVQTIYPGGTGGDVVAGDLVILTPGGGFGPFGNACRTQYGNSYDW